MKKLIFLPLFFFSTFSIIAQHNWIRTNPGGGGAFSTIAAGPPAQNGGSQIIAGSDLSGAYYSWDGGQSWDVYGAERGLYETHVSGIGFHPTSAEIFFLGMDGGIFKSATGGGWLYQVLFSGYIPDVHVATANPSIVYAAYQPQYNSNQGVVYRSINSGEAFSQISNNSLPGGLHILKIISHPTNANTVYALTGEGRFATGPAKVFRSIDGGMNWIDISPSNDDAMDIAIDPNNGSIVYVSTMQPNGNDGVDCSSGNLGSLYKSVNGGSSWGSPIASYTGVIFIDKNNSSTVRLLDPRCPYWWLDDSGTWTSNDGGNNWTNTGNPTNWTNGYQSNPAWAYGASYNGIVKTLGDSYASSDNIFWTNVQWAFGSFNGGTDFQHLHTQEQSSGWWQSTGFDNVVPLEIAINESNPDEIYIGYADIGLWRSLDGGASWQASNEEDYTGSWFGFGGNTRSLLCDPDRAGKVWVSQQGDANETAFVLTSSQSGALGTWTNVSTGLPNGTLLLGLSLDRNSPTNNRTLFVTMDGNVYRSQNDGTSWQLVLSNGGLYFTAVDEINGQIVYAGGYDGLHRSLNGGDTWSKVLNAPVVSPFDPSPYHEQYGGVMDIEPDPNVEGKVLVAMYGDPGGGLMKSENTGTTWTTFYPNPYMRTVAIAPQNSDIIYAGSSFAFYRGFYHENSEGVLLSTDGGQSWEQVNEDMPWHFAVTMEIDKATIPRIFVGSPGTGFQYANLADNAMSIQHHSSFSARIENSQAILEWQVSSREQFHYFNIQRSLDARNWKTIQKKLAISNQNFYIFEDGNPLEGRSFYRLEKIKSNGESLFSNVESVFFEKTGNAIQVFPNPFSQSFYLQFSEQPNYKPNLELFDFSGKWMETLSGQWLGNQLEVNIDKTLSGGIYWLQVRQANDVNWIKLYKVN